MKENAANKDILFDSDSQDKEATNDNDVRRDRSENGSFFEP